MYASAHFGYSPGGYQRVPMVPPQSPVLGAADATVGTEPVDESQPPTVMPFPPVHVGEPDVIDGFVFMAPPQSPAPSALAPEALHAAAHNGPPPPMAPAPDDGLDTNIPLSERWYVVYRGIVPSVVQGL